MRNVAPVLITVLYPLAVYFGLGRLEPRWLAFLLLGLALVRMAASRERAGWIAAVAASALALVTFFANATMPLKLYPVILNGLLCALFTSSLSHPPTAIERLAKLTNPELPPEAVAYTRKVTQVWCAFFLFNGSMALGTALWASDVDWVLYNGLIAYGLMGLLFGCEWLVRRRVMLKVSRV